MVTQAIPLIKGRKTSHVYCAKVAGTWYQVATMRGPAGLIGIYDKPRYDDHIDYVSSNDLAYIKATDFEKQFKDDE